MEFIRSVYDRQTYSSRLTRQYLGIAEDSIVDSLIQKMQCLQMDEHSVTSRCTDMEEYLEDDSLMVPPFACKFCKVPGKENILAVANEEGELHIMNTDLHGQSAYIEVFSCHRNAIFDICWAPNEYKIITASGDKTSLLWDIQQGKAVKVCKGHTGSIKTVEFQPGSNDVIATGARDGCVMLWDFRSQHAAAKHEGKHLYDCCHADDIIRNAHSFVDQKLLSNVKKKNRYLLLQDNVQSITAMTFQNETTLITAGPSDGLIKVWDLRKHYSIYKKTPCPKYTFKYSGRSIKNQGFSNLIMDSRHCRLFANCTDNVIYQYDCCSYDSSPVAVFKGHENFSFFVRATLSPDDKFLISGSSDNNAYIWKVDRPSLPLYKLEGHQAEVTNVAWNNSPIPRIITCADDMKLKIWNIKDDKIEDETAITGKAVKMQDVIPKCHSSGAHKSQKSTPSQVPERSDMQYINVEINNNLQVTPCRKNVNKSSSDTANCSFYEGHLTSRTPPSLMQWLSPSGCDQLNQQRIKALSRSPQSNKNPVNKRLSEKSNLDNRISNHKIDDKTINQENEFCHVKQVPRNPRLVLSQKKTSNEENIKVDKASRSLFSDSFCEQTFNTPNKVNTSDTFLSPTVNLPNLVLENSSSRNLAVEKKAVQLKQQQKDWLTEMTANFKPKLQMKSKDKISKSYQSPRAIKRKKSSRSSSPKACQQISKCPRKQDIMKFFSPTTIMH